LTLWVIDASVVVKWYVPEGDPAAAHALRQSRPQLAAPDLLFVETANIVWKLVRRGEMQPARATDIIEEIVAAPFIVHPNRTLARDAIDLAVATGLSAYDASYLALAIRLDTLCITADQKLVRKLAGTQHANQVRLLTEYVH
jgi:predicted nucleic acid-binding protein